MWVLDRLHNSVDAELKFLPKFSSRWKCTDFSEKPIISPPTDQSRTNWSKFYYQSAKWAGFTTDWLSLPMINNAACNVFTVQPQETPSEWL